MKLPFKKHRTETILQKKGEWYLVFGKEKSGVVYTATLHACEDAVKYDKGLSKATFTPDMEEGCPFCKEDIPDVLAVTKKLINGENR